MTDEAMVEAVARALCLAGDDHPDVECINYSMKGRLRWEIYREDAIAAIRALAPLIVEQCAEVARRHADEHARSLGAYGAVDVDHGRGRQEGHIDAGNAIAQGILALNHSVGVTGMVNALTRNAGLKNEA